MWITIAESRRRGSDQIEPRCRETRRDRDTSCGAPFGAAVTSSRWTNAQSAAFGRAESGQVRRSARARKRKAL